MAEKKEGSKGGLNSFLDSVEEIIIENWLWIIVLVAGYFTFRYDMQYTALKIILPVVGVVLLGRIAWVLWVHYVQQDFISGIDFVLLEIVPPRDVLRSPKAMELFFTNALYHWSMKGGREEWWQGAVWFWFSLEIVSIDGQVHFYIRTPKKFKKMVQK